MPIAFVFHFHLSHPLVFQYSQWKTTGKLIYIPLVLTSHDVMIPSLEKHIYMSFVFNHHDVIQKLSPIKSHKIYKKQKKIHRMATRNIFVSVN